MGAKRVEKDLRRRLSVLVYLFSFVQCYWPCGHCSRESCPVVTVLVSLAAVGCEKKEDRSVVVVLFLEGE